MNKICRDERKDADSVEFTHYSLLATRHSLPATRWRGEPCIYLDLTFKLGLRYRNSGLWTHVPRVCLASGSFYVVFLHP
jgi:hypothetical protein